MDSNNNTHLVITVISSNNVQYVINLVVTIALIVGIAIGMLTQFLLSKVTVSKFFKISIYIISFVASIIAILQAFGKWDYLMKLVHGLF